MVPERIKDRTNQSFSNISSSRGSTIIFDLSKSFNFTTLSSDLLAEIDFFSLYKHLKMVRDHKEKTVKICSPFFVVQNQTQKEQYKF